MLIRHIADRWRHWRTGSASADAISEQQWQALEHRLPVLAHLTANERVNLRALALEFVAQKQWYGAQGFVLGTDIRLAIALQACLLVLKLGLQWYRDWVGIIVYPGDFVVPRQDVDDAGVVHEYDDAVLGEAWQGGPVLLSWIDDGADGNNGIQVVVHEFAHKLDMCNGVADGLPSLHEDMSREEWSAAFNAAFEDFCVRVDRAEHAGIDTALDPYASETPAEFFAVMSEAFFATPRLLLKEYPAVYAQLRLFYRQDPACSSPD